MNGRYEKSRKIKERILIRGMLVLETPAHFGNGDAEGVADMPLARDPRTSLPLLTGASIAGALRSFSREIERGYGVEESGSQPLCTEKLFGYIATGDQDASVLSWLLVEDAVAEEEIGLELRDGVTIHPTTRAAEEGKKFDIELLPAGTRFKLCFELLAPAGDPGRELVHTLAVALQGLQEGEIGLGQRKRRGFGRCRVDDWQALRYDMSSPAGLVGWLEEDKAGMQPGDDIAELLLGEKLPHVGRRQEARVEACFKIDGSLLIRSGGQAPKAPDSVHLRNFALEPVLPGTSLAGVLRSRARMIARLMLPQQADQLVDSVFGPQMSEGASPRGSRLWVEESTITHPTEQVQTRVTIDRFTGGAMPQHLFSEQPLYSGEVKVNLRLQRAQDAEIGLLLLLLKDLGTGDLPVGGQSSVGRGRLHASAIALEYHDQTWKIEQEGDQVRVTTGEAECLEGFVKALPAWKEVEK